MSLPQIYTAALALAVAYAWLKGSPTSHRIALAYLLAQLAAMAASQARWDVFQAQLALIDIMLWVWLLWVTIKTPLYWPIASAALQTLTVLGHVARFVVPTMNKLAYAVLLQWTAWPAWIVILIGVSLDWRAARTSPKYYRWRASAIRNLSRIISSKR